MSKTKLVLIISLIILTIGIITNIDLVFGSNAPLDENRNPSVWGADCNISTVSKVQIGNQLSTQVFASTTKRAWARIQIDNNATNTVYVAFGATATVNNGIGLGVGNGTTGVGTSTPYIDFGLKTVFPYSGIVNAITNNGTTTVLVTECVFN